MVLNRVISQKLNEWDEKLQKSDKGIPVRPLQHRVSVRKLPKTAEVSEDAPNAVWTKPRDPRRDREVYRYDGSRGAVPARSELYKRLVAPAAGFISAALEITLVWPTEYAKVQLQLNRGTKDFNIVSHFRQQGFAVYRGLSPLLIGAPLQGMLRFGSLDFFNGAFRDPETGKVGRASGLLAGICAGILESIIVVTPMETVKTRLIDSGKGLLDGTRFVIGKFGIAGLYRGLWATMAKSCSNQALRFAIFNEYKTLVVGNRPIHELSAVESLVGGMTAGCLGACINTPFDTVKTRMQGLQAFQYKSLAHCAATMVTEEGILSLWKGLTARLMRVVPGQGIIFCSYETINNALTKALVEGIAE